jgi:predicted amidohydrolase YtcJ
MIIHVAYPSGEQDSKGSPEPGNLGDLVILNRNTAKVSANGTFRTSHPLRRMSAFGGKADMTQTAVMSANDPKRTFMRRGIGSA